MNAANFSETAPVAKSTSLLPVPVTGKKQRSSDLPRTKAELLAHARRAITAGNLACREAAAAIAMAIKKHRASQKARDLGEPVAEIAARRFPGVRVTVVTV